MRYFDYLPDSIDRPAIESIHRERQQWVNQPKKGFLRYREPYRFLKQYSAEHLVCDVDTVTIGSAEEIDPGQQDKIRERLKSFMPWRKGPFSVFGIDIDAEWRSERKWKRLQGHLPDLSGKTVADIGCNNGYYMFRMVPHRPHYVLGFEPSVQHYYCCKALREMAGCVNLDIDLLGVEHIALFREAFDVIFLMGIIYHRISPIELLKDIHTALKPGGTLVVESQAIPGDEPVALFPEKTYAKVPGTYFVPTGAALKNWLLRSGFAPVELFCSHPMNAAEQRRTEWMVFESYDNYLDPHNQELTAEGYPAPWRVFLSAAKPQQ